jgi:hypothetical protein
MSLQARLDRIRESFQKDAPAEVLEIFHRVPEDLRASGIIDLAEGNGDDSWTLPIPARYIIDRDGVIRYARTDPDHTRRPEPEETVEALREL